MARTVVLVLASLVLSCGARSVAPDSEAHIVAAGDAGDTVTARTCAHASDCAAGEDCVGPPGCGVVWTCQPQRPCTRDLVEYCACDGRTVGGSSRCPPEPYQHRGPCN